MIASTMVRASANGLPARPVRVGSIGAINSHWASESIWNRDMSPGSQLTRASILRHALGRMVPEPGMQKVAVRPNRWVWVEEGNHSCLDLGPAAPGALRIAHVPHRSLEQRVQKAVVGAAALGRASSLGSHIGYHWRTAAGQGEDELAAAWVQEVEAARRLPVVPLPTAWERWNHPS
ncbi:hypothetical protein MICRO80W_70036 [Micrococcus luteus]|nr:hypothetical protein MICRO80W_70036 [Micrococcus luteus]